MVVAVASETQTNATEQRGGERALGSAFEWAKGPSDNLDNIARHSSVESSGGHAAGTAAVPCVSQPMTASGGDDTITICVEEEGDRPYGGDVLSARKIDSNSGLGFSGDLDNEYGICFDKIALCDVPLLRTLHEECFPLSYNDKFYENVGKHRYMGMPLITMVARMPVEVSSLYSNKELLGPNVDSGSVARPRSPESSLQDVHKTACSVGDPKLSDLSDGFKEKQIEVRQQVSYSVAGQPGQWKFLGGVTAQIVHLDDDDDQQPLLTQQSKDQGYTRGCYVLTLATDKAARRKGVGSALLKHVIEIARQDTSCGTVYLHVITYNQGALRFYESHGFVCVDRIKNFYKIKGKHYDSFLFALFLGSAQPRAPSFWTNMLRTVSSFLNSITSFF